MVYSNQTEKKVSPSFSLLFLLFGIFTGMIHLIQGDILLKLAGVVFLTLAFLAWWPKLQKDDLQGIAAHCLAVFSTATIFLYFFIENLQGLESAVGMVAKVCEVMICLTYLGSKIAAVRKKKAAVVYAAIPRYARPAPVAKRPH